MKRRLRLVITSALCVSLTACAGYVEKKPGESVPGAESSFNDSVSLTSALTENAPQSVFPQHEPYGTGIGAMPGRVVWDFDPQSVDWNGEGYWWRTENFHEDTVQKMVDDSVAVLGGADHVKAGWEILFCAHNERRGKGNRGYVQGEKIAIKANMNGSGVFADDTSGETQMSYTNPVLLKAMLLSLVNEAGVAPENITVYDVSRVFPDYMIEMCSSGSLEGVNFRYRDILGTNDAATDTSSPVIWSREFAGAANYLPVCVTEAEYLINLANLKGHSYGITLGAKNHFGSLMNTSRLRPPEAAGIHRFVADGKMNAYTVLVDLMANYQLGEKTVLYMLDALICAPSEGASITGANSRWRQEPFDGDYTSSVLVSQDPVALDSVGADFLVNEPVIAEHNPVLRNNPNVENYLHEAGLVANAPSGTAYYNGNRERVTNLGVHEHWNSAVEKQYGRNLGKSEGIELIKIGTD
ncbi:DUF362 domain-containing protein [Enterocloster bolteae]|uniref:DUF362 domain-containing protein n=1 Tax=Enterocloster bolteae TaxID=208479 RepID=UPI0028DCEF07|nr:DUF362 domain-containing protein [Enterocloster bolteae]